MRRLLVGLAVVAAVFGGACSSKSKDVAGDVSLSSCTADASGGRPKAAGSIHNTSSKDSGYAFRIEFKDSDGNKVSDGAVTVAKVKAGATASWDATGAASARGNLSCDVRGVPRTAVP
jgi:hypothetical protein